MTPAERIIAMLDERNIEYKDFAESIGVKPQKISEWKNGTTKSYNKYLPEICNELGVTIDYIMYGESEKSDPLQQNESVEQVVELFAALPEDKKKEAVSYLSFLNSQSQKGE